MKSKNIDKLILSRSVNAKKLNLEKRQSVVALPGIALSLLINKNSERQKSVFEGKNSTSYIKEQKLNSLTPILMRNFAQNFKISNIKRNVQRIKCVSSLKNYKINLKAENQYQNYKFKTKQSQQQISTNSQANLKSKQQKQYIENKSTCNIDQFRPFQEINFYNNRPEEITISQKNYKKNIFFENQQNNLKSSSIEKKYQSIGISTDPQFNNESQKEFIKFKLTQKQNFSKLQGYKRIKQQMEEQVVKRFNQLQKCSKKWSQAQSQKDYLIKICVQGIIKLPQLSLTIFGMGSNEGAIEQMSALQKIGIMLNQIEQFGTLCNPESKSKFRFKNENVDIDQFFRNIMNVKCLNCSYLKSKMKFIYNKNSQLQTTLKVINKLADIQKLN